jgi:hypothetical protein
MDDDGVALGDARHRVAHRRDPARVLVPERVWERGVEDVLQQAFDDVQVSPAQASAGDSYDDIVVALHLGLSDLVDSQMTLVVAMQPRRLHGRSPNLAGRPAPNADVLGAYSARVAPSNSTDPHSP